MSGSAAVLPSAIYNGEKYYYFGLEKNNKLSTFGGTKDAQESHEKCAQREFIEESLEVFATKKKVDKIFKKARFTAIENVSAAHKNITYIVPIKKAKNFSKKFEEAIQNPQLKACQKEMKKIVAVKAKVLKQGLESGSCVFEGYPLRGCVVGTLKIALKNKAL